MGSLYWIRGEQPCKIGSLEDDSSFGPRLLAAELSIDQTPDPAMER